MTSGSDSCAECIKGSRCVCYWSCVFSWSSYISLLVKLMKIHFKLNWWYVPILHVTWVWSWFHSSSFLIFRLRPCFYWKKAGQSSCWRVAHRWIKVVEKNVIFPFIDNQRHDSVVVWETSDLCTCILIDRARALKHYTRSAPCCDNFKRRSLVSMSSKSQNLKDTLMET